MGILTEALRLARMEAKALAARLQAEDTKAVTDYNIMMGNLEDPAEDEEMEGENNG